MMNPTPLLATVLLSSVASVHAGFTIDTLVIEGDSIPGVGLVTTIDNFVVNSIGEWAVEADTDAGPDVDSVLIRNGVLFLREGDGIAMPAGAMVDSFDSIPLADVAKSTTYNLFLDGTDGSNDDSGVFFALTEDWAGLVLVVQEGQAAPGLSQGTPFIGFFETRVNSAGEIFVMASVDDPNINSTVDRAMYILTTDAEAGGIETFEVIAVEGDILPGQTEPVADFRTNPHQMAFAENGDLLFGADLAGDTAVDDTVYLATEAGLALIAQQGSLSPVDGRTWSSLSSPEMDLNSNGQFVYSGSLDGDPATNVVIVRNDAVLAQEGDVVTTETGTWMVTGFGSGPVLIDDCGNVLHYRDWNDPDGDVDTGLFINDMLIVQEGVSTVDGVAIDTLRGVQDGYAFSDNGQYVLFEAILVDGRDGAFLIDLGAGCDGDPCVGDFDRSGDVGATDLLALLGAWGGSDPMFDLDPDGVIGVGDLLAFLGVWGPC